MINNRILKRMMHYLSILFFLVSAHSVESRSFFSASPLSNPYTQSASSYLELANHQAGQDRQALELKAAGSYIYSGQLQDGFKLLQAMPSLPSELMIERNLLLSKIYLMRNQQDKAIQTLALVRNLDSMPLFFQVQYHEMLATAFRATGNRVEALNERIKLDKLLPEEALRLNNRRALWLMLTMMPASELNTLAVEPSEDPALNGWIQLAVIARRDASDVSKTLGALEQWQANFPNHPGNTLLPSPLTQIEPYLFSSPKKIALLLPISGKLSGPGNAVQDGFMQAYNAENKTLELSVRVYDTDKASATDLYQQAITDGADYVVGPLGKADVAAIASLSHPVPTIMLNDVESRIRPNAYQFGLSPVNEARQVAVRARKNGHHRALVISPANKWGDEVVEAFSRQWGAGGGEIVDRLRYGESDDLALAVKNVLHAVDLKRPSRNRSGQIQPLHYKGPYRRQDFDMIFLLAYPSKARQVMPLLRYFYAGNVPVYSTSAVYSGSIDPQKDRDLDGIVFCDMPWVFNHQMGQKSWPEQWNSYNRLFALGMDSFVLVEQLNQLLLFPAMGITESSGVLYLNANQQIARILSWGKIQSGRAEQII